MSQYAFFSVSAGSEGSSITTGNVSVGDRKASVSAKSAGAAAAATTAAPAIAAAAADGSTGGKEPVFEFDRLRVRVHLLPTAKRDEIFAFFFL